MDVSSPVDAHLTIYIDLLSENHETDGSIKNDVDDWHKPD